MEQWSWRPEEKPGDPLHSIVLVAKWSKVVPTSWMESAMQAEPRSCEAPVEHESPGDWTEPAVGTETMGWEEIREGQGYPAG